MFYLLLYEVVDRYAELRKPHRDAHLRLAHEAHERGDLILAGALGEPIDGAALLFKTASASVVDHFAKNDPYVKAGLVKTWHVRPWNVVVGTDIQTRPAGL